MRISDLYDQYNLMPQLREHQLRVGGIVKLITSDHDSIITALVHDVGNIVKFDNLDPDWSRVRTETKVLYGSDAHLATDQMLRRVGLGKYADYLIEESRIYQEDNITKDYFGNMTSPAVLTLYGDLRVKPSGICNMSERLLDLEKRYRHLRPEQKWAGLLESYVQTMTKIDLNSINEEMVSPLFEELLSYNI